MTNLLSQPHFLHFYHHLLTSLSLIILFTHHNISLKIVKIKKPTSDTSDKCSWACAVLSIYKFRQVLAVATWASLIWLFKFTAVNLVFNHFIITPSEVEASNREHSVLHRELSCWEVLDFLWEYFKQRRSTEGEDSSAVSVLVAGFEVFFSIAFNSMLPALGNLKEVLSFILRLIPFGFAWDIFTKNSTTIKSSKFSFTLGFSVNSSSFFLSHKHFLIPATVS